MKKKKVLLIAHFFEPCNIIAAHRPKSWAIALSKEGYEVTVLTRNWNGIEKNWTDYLAENTATESLVQNEFYQTVFVPHKHSLLYKLSYFSILKRIKIVRFFLEIFSSIIGQIDFDRNLTSKHYFHLKKLVDVSQFEIIISTAGPYTSLKLAQFISKKHRIPWIADFRDVWNMDYLLIDQTKKSIKNSLRTIAHDYYIKKWLKSSSLVVLCSEGFEDTFKQLAPKKKTIYIKNGYEKSLFDHIPENIQNTQFTILYSGTLYEEQNLTDFFNAINEILKTNKSDIIIKFIGAKVNQTVSQTIEKNIPKENLILTDFMPRKDVLSEIKNADLLFYPVWKGYKGIYSGKIFEYIGSKKNILICPGDFFVLDHLIQSTKSGYIANSEKECFEIISELLNEWKKNKGIKFNGNISEINKYTRENQAEILVHEVKQLIGL